MQFKLWLETSVSPKFASWNSYGDLVVYIGPVKYTYFTRNAAIARKAYAAGQYDPWGTLDRVKRGGYEMTKSGGPASQLTLF